MSNLLESYLMKSVAELNEEEFDMEVSTLMSLRMTTSPVEAISPPLSPPQQSSFLTPIAIKAGAAGVETVPPSVFEPKNLFQEEEEEDRKPAFVRFFRPNEFGYIMPEFLVFENEGMTYAWYSGRMYREEGNVEGRVVVQIKGRSFVVADDVSFLFN